jgi:hypothetical protein
VFLNYKNAKKYVNSLGLGSRPDWDNYRRKNLMPFYISSTPDRTYKNNGWISWQDWLGYKKERSRGWEWQHVK